MILDFSVWFYSSCRRSIMGRTLVLAGEHSLSCTRLLAGRVTMDMWLCRPNSVSQHGQLSLPSFWGQLMSSNPCCSGLPRQTTGVVRGVACRPHQWVLLATRLECRLAAGSRPRNGDERLALWEITSHRGLCLMSLSKQSIKLNGYLNHIKIKVTINNCLVGLFRRVRVSLRWRSTVLPLISLIVSIITLMASAVPRYAVSPRTTKTRTSICFDFRFRL